MLGVLRKQQQEEVVIEKKNQCTYIFLRYFFIPGVGDGRCYFCNVISSSAMKVMCALRSYEKMGVNFQEST